MSSSFQSISSSLPQISSTSRHQVTRESTTEAEPFVTSQLESHKIARLNDFYLFQAMKDDELTLVQCELSRRVKRNTPSHSMTPYLGYIAAQDNLNTKMLNVFLDALETLKEQEVHIGRGYREPSFSSSSFLTRTVEQEIESLCMERIQSLNKAVEEQNERAVRNIVSEDKEKGSSSMGAAFLLKALKIATSQENPSNKITKILLSTYCKKITAPTQHLIDAPLTGEQETAPEPFYHRTVVNFQRESLPSNVPAQRHPIRNHIEGPHPKRRRVEPPAAFLSEDITPFRPKQEQPMLNFLSQPPSRVEAFTSLQAQIETPFRPKQEQPMLNFLSQPPSRAEAFTSFQAQIETPFRQKQELGPTNIPDSLLTHRFVGIPPFEPFAFKVRYPEAFASIEKNDKSKVEQFLSNLPQNEWFSSILSTILILAATYGANEVAELLLTNYKDQINETHQKNAAIEALKENHQQITIDIIQQGDLQGFYLEKLLTSIMTEKQTLSSEDERVIETLLNNSKISDSSKWVILEHFEKINNKELLKKAVPYYINRQKCGEIIKKAVFRKDLTFMQTVLNKDRDMQPSQRGQILALVIRTIDPSEERYKALQLVLNTQEYIPFKDVESAIQYGRKHNDSKLLDMLKNYIKTFLKEGKAERNQKQQLSRLLKTI
ncbi:MAG: hypothetical protein Q8L98_04915 [Chlamydiales bacterium]|nr:hypothetical protein [Chlamydiales bacterium]